MTDAGTVARTTSLSKIDEVMAKQVEQGEITGAITAIAIRGETVHFSTHGWRDVENAVPMPPDALFRMASSTKPVAGVAVMMMVEQGLIDVEAPVYEYIPEFRGAQVAVKKPRSAAEPPPPSDGEALGAPNLGAGLAARRKVDPSEVDLVPANREITVEDLLTHTSGLLSGGLGSAITTLTRSAGDTLADHIPRLGTVPLDFQPGTRWRYSPGAGIDTLGRIVEIVSGQSFDEFLRTRIFEPVGMVDTFFSVPEDRKDRLLPLYRKTEEGFTNVGLRSPMSSRTYFSGSGGLVSSAADYLRFERMLANGGEIDGNRVLRPETVQLMATNHVGDLFEGLREPKIRGLGFGYTVQVVLDRDTARSARSTGAFGWGGAFGTMTWSDPALQLAGVYMVQQPNLVVRARFERAVRAAVDALD